MNSSAANNIDRKTRQRAPINKAAVFAGVVCFLALYVILALGLVFALSLLSEHFASRWIEQLFKLSGLAALLFPGYVATRIAGHDGLLHGLLTGAGAAALSAAFLMLTFSWEGTGREAVWLAIVKITVLGLTAGSLGGLLGDWRNRKQRTRTG